MKREDFVKLVDAYLAGTATPRERILLEEYYIRLASQDNNSLKQESEEHKSEDQQSKERKSKEQESEENIQAAVLEKIMLGIMPTLSNHQLSDHRVEASVTDATVVEASMEEAPVVEIKKRRRWMAVAAIFAGAVGVGGYFALSFHPKTDAVRIKAPVVNDIAPGGDKAILTLANGEKIVLDTAKGGAISQQGNIRVIKQADGQLSYKEGGKTGAGVSSNSTEPIYNTLATPRGGQYRLVLSDGTKVWLNAASSLRYPASFSGAERIVDITGEAYFEVERNAAMPFKVRVNGAEVQVLGTAFNIMAYDDEAAVNTTLLEGMVRVNKGNATKTLKPGQQLSLGLDGRMELVDDADIDEAVAWKNNLFTFNDADIQSVMRQIGRWYDVDIKYSGKVPQHFNGNISRSVNVSKVFSMLELTGSVHFKIDGKEILVSPEKSEKTEKN